MTEVDNGERGGGVSAALALFSLGITSGMLILLIAFTLVPEAKNPTTEEFDAIRSFAEEHFVREVDDEELMVRALHGMLDDLDPYSRYYERALSERVRREIDGDFRGIGVVFTQPTSDAQVLFPIEDSPASEAGVQVGDRILEINGESVAGLDGSELRSRLAPAGVRTVELRVEGLDGRLRDLSLEPRLLVDPTVRHAGVLEGAPGVGYLAVRSFTNNTTREFDAAVSSLIEQGISGLVIDLRYNYGGVLDAAVHMAGRFIDRGIVVSSEGRRQSEVHLADIVEPLFAGLDVCVLVDGDSASASEVLAGALQDHRLAVVVGEPTFGKGMLQTTRSFPRFGSRAKVTSAYFYSPSHRNFERTADPDRDHGILPDLEVSIDPQLRRSLHAWIARYDPPTESLAALLRWEQEADRVLLPEPPIDPQLSAAIALLRGDRPVPHAWNE